jgi:class 3 adenylate cyclase
MVQRVFTWFYRRLGPAYPIAFIVLELQSAFVIVLGTLGLFTLYYDVDSGEFFIVLGTALATSAFAILMAVYRAVAYTRPLRTWIKGERGPDATARAWVSAVGLPAYLLRRDVSLPIFVVAIPTAILAVVLYELSWLAFFPFLAAGLVAIGYGGILHYLALEAGMRPVLVDINREVTPRRETGVDVIPLRVKLLTALPLISVIAGLVSSALSGDGGGGAGSLGLDVAIAVGVAGTIAFELSWMLAKSILRPLDDLQRGFKAVQAGRYDVSVPVTTADEIGELQATFNQMVAGLAERERIREAFGTYLDKEIAEYILSDDYAPEGFEVEVSVLFCDVRNFTGFAEDADPTEVVGRLNELFETVVPIVAGHGGHVDKFIGDGLLAVFGAPERFEDHADRAVRAAIDMAECVNRDLDTPLRVGIGVNSGTVVAGSIGGAGRLNFSVIGDPVNVAARVEATTRQLGDDILITGATREMLTQSFELAERGSRELRGKSEPVELWAPVGPAPPPESKAVPGAAGRGAASVGRSGA